MVFGGDGKVLDGRPVEGEQGNPDPGHYVVAFNTETNSPNISGGPSEAANTIIHEMLHVAYGL